MSTKDIYKDIETEEKQVSTPLVEFANQSFIAVNSVGNEQKAKISTSGQPSSTI